MQMTAHSRMALNFDRKHTVIELLMYPTILLPLVLSAVLAVG